MASTHKQDSQRQILLKQELLKWEAFNRLAQSQDYLQYLKPVLQQALTNKWPDPLQTNFGDAYKVEYARAKAFEEIINIMASAESMIKNLVKQLEEPEKNYEI
jgi:ribosome-binding ATPase YchF (GTP1/OBG family)